jgi:hypothetical protein
VTTLLDLCQAFHSYLMKYVGMICRGRVPTTPNGKINPDTKNFIRYFVARGTRLNKATLGKAIRHLHLAFKGMETEEIYDVLMEQFLRAAAKYDPRYGDKLKQVVEVIENALSKYPGFHAADVQRHVEFDCHRYLRLLCRRGFLIAKAGQERSRYRPDSVTGATARHLPARLTPISPGSNRSRANARR